jgi:P-type Cu+ transporter
MTTDVRQTIEQQRDRAEAQAHSDCHAALALEGMTCASCAMRIEKGLKKLPGVKEASVNFASEQATVTYDPAQTGPEQMVRSVEALGYTASPVSQRQRSSSYSSASGAVMGVTQEDEQNRRGRRRFTASYCC